MPTIRTSPSGPVIRGTNTGDILTWDATLQEWVVTSPLPPVPPPP